MKLSMKQRQTHRYRELVVARRMGEGVALKVWDCKLLLLYASYYYYN